MVNFAKDLPLTFWGIPTFQELPGWEREFS